MPSPNPNFAHYCCELLSTAGHCIAKRMFGGWGISSDGLTFALVTDLGSGETLWLKADADTRATFEAAGCARFTYDVKGQPKSMNYYSAPDDALESPDLMRPWARMAMESALRAANAKPAKPTKPAKAARPRKVTPRPISAKTAPKKTTQA